MIFLLLLILLLPVNAHADSRFGLFTGPKEGMCPTGYSGETYKTRGVRGGDHTIVRYTMAGPSAKAVPREHLLFVSVFWKTKDGHDFLYGMADPTLDPDLAKIAEGEPIELVWTYFGHGETGDKPPQCAYMRIVKKVIKPDKP